MNNKMNVICPSCGAEFNKNLSQCPYCGNSNYYGQEKSYMKGLAGLRQRLAELADINKKNNCRRGCKSACPCTGGCNHTGGSYIFCKSN